MTDVTKADNGNQRSGIIHELAAHYAMSAQLFMDTIIATVLPKGSTREDMITFLSVAKQYNLNPFTKEIYGFPGRGGGIQTVVSIDGWLKIINDNPQLDGIETTEHRDQEGQLVAITATVWRKDRAHPTVVTEYYEECSRETDPWKKYPVRMLRHKALIQCARYAFGYAGITEPDEAERALDVSPMVEVNLPPKATLKDKMDAIAKRKGKPDSEDIKPDNSDPAPDASSHPAAGAPESTSNREQAAGEGSGSPPYPDPAATLSDQEKGRLRQLHDGLNLAKSEKSVDATWRKFQELYTLTDHPRLIAQNIWDFHTLRVRGDSSPAQTDARVAELLA